MSPLAVVVVVVLLVYERLSRPRDGWMSSERCPVGIYIDLSQVTPIGNKTDSSLLYSHTQTHACTLTSGTSTHTYNSVATCVCARQVLHRPLLCLFKRSPIMITIFNLLLCGPASQRAVGLQPLLITRASTAHQLFLFLDWVALQCMCTHI